MLCKYFIKKQQILLLIILILFTSISISYGLFAGGHTVYMNTTGPVYDNIEFCVKCHRNVIETVLAGEHRSAGCICHGYNPNGSTMYNVNVKHNLTKDIYCTNCHSNFNETGQITINNSLSGLNQSGHYITANSTILFNHSKEFFN